MLSKNRFRHEEKNEIKIVSEELVDKPIIDFDFMYQQLVLSKDSSSNNNKINTTISYLIKVA